MQMQRAILITDGSMTRLTLTKRKLGTFDVETRGSNAVETIPIFENIEDNVEEPMHKQPRVENTPLSVEEATIVDPCVLASCEKKVKSLMEEFVNEKLTLKVYSEKREYKINTIVKFVALIWNR